MFNKNNANTLADIAPIAWVFLSAQQTLMYPGDAGKHYLPFTDEEVSYREIKWFSLSPHKQSVAELETESRCQVTASAVTTK